MKKKICNCPSCNNLICQSDSYCDKHKNPKSVPFQNAVRSNELYYNTSRWRGLRKQKINEQPYCSKCGVSSKETSLHVHHIVEPRGEENLFFNYENLDVLCENCHRRETAREIKDRRKGQ
jgi:5-methylcytosine-specific restriction protein A